MFGKLKSLFSTDIGIDLGTANSLVYVKERGGEGIVQGVFRLTSPLDGLRKIA